MSVISANSTEFKRLSSCLASCIDEVHKIIVGQQDMIESCFIALLSGGHVLIEGYPGLAKTLTISSVAQATHLKFQRVQFTPDLLPTDIIGTMVYHSPTNEFTLKKGPIFTNILLTDEVNRAPAKVQSALLEAMGEKQVTIANETHDLPQPFLVLATQNPIEQEGTYPLPEAQMDRFLFKVLVQYPSSDEEKEIFKRMSQQKIHSVAPQLEKEDILKLKILAQSVYMDEKLTNYMVDLVLATREPKKYGLLDVAQWIQIGASPRATVSFPKACRARAFIKGRDHVNLEDVRTMAYPILRHRLILNYEAEAENISPDQIIELILKQVQVREL